MIQSVGPTGAVPPAPGAADADAVGFRATLARLLDRDPVVGIAAALDILAGEPRVKPSHALLIDPTDAVHRRWLRRVAAGAALVASPAIVRVAAEVTDELAESPELAREVLAAAEPHSALPAAQRAALLALRG